MRRVVFEAPVIGRIMRRRDYDTVGQSRFSPAVVTQNRVGDGWGRGVRCSFGDHYFDVICRKHFHRARKCRFRQSVGIHPQEQRTVDVLGFTVIANCLRDRQDVTLVERPIKRRSAMAGRTEDNPLSGIARIGPQLVVGCDELRDVNKNGWVGRFPGSRVNCHAAPRLHPIKESRSIEVRAENRFAPV